MHLNATKGIEDLEARMHARMHAHVHLAINSCQWRASKKYAYTQTHGLPNLFLIVPLQGLLRWMCTDGN